MRRRVVGVLAACLAMIASVFAAGPASAVPATWTVTPGGAFTGTAGVTVLEIQETGIQLSCVSATADGIAQSGSGLSNPLATLPETPGVRFNQCTGPFGITFSVTHVGTWNLNGVSYDAATGVTTGAIDNIRANIVGTGCNAVVSGAVDATFTNGTDALRVLKNFTLLIEFVDPVENCLGAISTGQHAGFDGNFIVSPGQEISMQP